MAHSAKQSTVGSFECRAIGTLSADNELAFQQLLTSMAGLPGLPVLQHAIVLKGPSQERSAPEIRLLHILASLPAAGGHDSGVVQHDRWLVQHEGLPLRGRGVAELPAAVRTVTVAHCDGADVLAFWQAMGFWLDHEMIQEGHHFALETTHQLQIIVARVYRLDIPNALDNKVEQVPGQLFVEVTAKASEGEYAAACQAIGSLAETLAPLCQLRKP